MVSVMEINMNGLSLKVHPVYDQYAASRGGKVVNLESENTMLGSPDISNKLSCSVKSKNKYINLSMNVTMDWYQME